MSFDPSVIARLLHVLGWTLLHFYWQGIAIWGVMLGLLGIFPRASSASRYFLACTALVLMAIAPVITALYLLGSEVRVQSSTAATFVRIPAEFQGPVEWRTSAATWLHEIPYWIDHQMPRMVVLWLCGVLLLCGRMGLGLAMVRRWKNLQEQAISQELQSLFHSLVRSLEIIRPVRLLCSAEVEVPIVLGWLRPVVLLPITAVTGLSVLQLEALLSHELMHIRRNDYLVNLLQSFVETLLFYHPAVWWVSQRVRREREHCCDDVAVRISGDRLAYAKALTFLEESRGVVPLMAVGSNGGILSMRIKRILGCEELPVVSRVGVLTVFIMAPILAGALYWGIQAKAQSAVPSQPSVRIAQEEASLPEGYRRWLEEDVHWIISPEERDAYLHLSGSEERDQFIKQFWERRNPEPGSAENKAREEHYRRIAYSNVHFDTNSGPGWASDRGRMYITYGKPDSIDSYPRGNGQETKPFEIWHYNLIRMRTGVSRTPEGSFKEDIEITRDVDMEFVDECQCGNYQLRVAPRFKNLQ